MSENEENAVSEKTETGELPISGKQLIKQVFKDGKSVFRLKFLIRLLSIIILSTILALLVIYGATIIANYTDSYPVKITGEGGKISLCESEGMEVPTSHLNMPVIRGMDNISGLVIPDSVDEMGGGSHNGDAYLAYTFYARNNIEGDLPIRERISIVSSSKHADEALRVRVYRDGVITTYAKETPDGTPEYGTTPFADDATVLSGESVLQRGQILRYTIVIWIEGDDPDCVNEICGGSVRLSMEFSASEP